MSVASSPDRFATPASNSPIPLPADNSDDQSDDENSSSVSVVSEVPRPGDEDFIGPNRDHSTDWEEGSVEAYSAHFFYCINFNRSARVPGADADLRIRLHDKRSRLMYNFFQKRTVARCVAVYFRNGSTQQDWDDFWSRQRTKWVGTSGRALVHIYFNGKSHGENDEYQWIIDGLDHHINAYALMQSLNQTNSDIQYLLDCWIQTRWTRRYKWRRKHAMMEIICAGPAKPDENGDMSPIQHGDFVPSFIRILGGFLNYSPTGFERPQPMKSTPQIMRRCTVLSNNAQRIWDLRPSTKTAKKGLEIWRIMTDPYICWATGKLYFYRKKIQPQPEPVEDEDSQAETEEDRMADVDPWDGQLDDLSEYEDEESDVQVELVPLHPDEGVEVDMEDGPSGDPEMDDVAHGHMGGHNGADAADVAMVDSDDGHSVG
ncbi:hypothetical protein Slin15195_G047140 [Septoria linicola]|uniref:Uncharacterized protein n=1 Tax=Septoria linicola TaxID=215465 RepID=A0A9Q9ALX1_9PEZI|nr:hypothetical protein Slin14017_G050670 [Septoria linicola]USW51395.1 hypothetical protein Slin15195_G047140 [Septoria linicola]